MKINWPKFAIVFPIGVFFFLFNLIIPQEEYEFYEDGSVKEKYHKNIFSNAKKGMAYYYYHNGKLERVVFYKDGELHGKDSSFYMSGNLKKVVNWHNGDVTDTVKVFNLLGYLKYTIIINDSTQNDTLFVQ